MRSSSNLNYVRYRGSSRSKYSLCRAEPGLEPVGQAVGHKIWNRQDQMDSAFHFVLPALCLGSGPAAVVPVEGPYRASLLRMAPSSKRGCLARLDLTWLDQAGPQDHKTGRPQTRPGPRGRIRLIPRNNWLTLSSMDGGVSSPRAQHGCPTRYGG